MFRTNVSVGCEILEYMDNFSMLFLMFNVSKLSKLKITTSYLPYLHFALLSY